MNFLWNKKIQKKTRTWSTLRHYRNRQNRRRKRQIEEIISSFRSYSEENIFITTQIIQLPSSPIPSTSREEIHRNSFPSPFPVIPPIQSLFSLPFSYQVLSETSQSSPHYSPISSLSRELNLQSSYSSISSPLQEEIPESFPEIQILSPVGSPSIEREPSPRPLSPTNSTSSVE